MNQLEYKKLIDKYLKGECSPSEEEILHKWYDSFEGRPDPISAFDDDNKEVLRKRMLDRIKANARIETSTEATVKRLWSSSYSIAASVAAVLLIVFGAFLYSQRSINERVSQTISSNEVFFKNTTKKLVKYTFPDGSIAWMRPSTIIRYKEDFNSAPVRKLQMIGEAFFEVTRNPQRPFIIQTGEVFTKVLGTSFNVKSYDGEKLTEVSVVTGKVLVYKEAAGNDGKKLEAFLLPKEKVLASVRAKKFVKLAETNKEMQIWQKNDLSFNNTPVKEVVAALNDRFKADIIIKDEEINNYQLSADFTDVNLPSALELLSKSLDVTYEINNAGITMSKTN